jgi:hypothetical protein
VTAYTCQGCGAALVKRGNRPPKWCSERCRKQTSYTGACVDCGGRTGYSGQVTPSERCNPCAGALKKVWTAEAIIEAIRAWADLHGRPPGAMDWNTSQHRESSTFAAKLERFYHGPRAWPHGSIVQREFSSWNAAVAAAGFEPRPSMRAGAESYAESAPRTVAAYRDGLSGPEIARREGVTEQAIYNRLEWAGEPRRRRVAA